MELEQRDKENQAKLLESQAQILQLKQKKQDGFATLRQQVQGLVVQIKQAAEAEVERGMAALELQVGRWEGWM